MRYAFLGTFIGEYSVRLMCLVSQLPPAGYTAGRKRPWIERRLADELLALHIMDVFLRSHETYGSPRVHADLQAAGMQVSKKRVARVMKERRPGGTSAGPAREHDGLQPRGADCAERGRPGVCRGGQPDGGSRVAGRYHVRPHGHRLALPGRGPRSRFAAVHRVGHAGLAGDRRGGQRVADGAGGPASRPPD